MRTLNRAAVVVLPKRPFLDWLHAVDASSADLGMDALREDPPVYLLPEGRDDKSHEERLKRVAGKIFEEELHGWWTDRAAWPRVRSFATFRAWFDWQFHSMVIDLSDRPLVREPL